MAIPAGALLLAAPLLIVLYRWATDNELSLTAVRVGGAVCIVLLLAFVALFEVLARESPADAAAHSESRRPPVVTAEHARTLEQSGYAVIDGVLSEDVCKRARADCASLVASGAFGTDDLQQRVVPSVRSDSVCWVSEDEGAGPFHQASALKPSKHAALLSALRSLRAIARELQASGVTAVRSNDMGVTREVQLARYLPSAAGGSGGRYAAHRDGVPFNTGGLFTRLLSVETAMRELTSLLYLTEPVAAWADEHAAAGVRVLPPRERARVRAGALVLYPGAGPADMTGATAAHIVEILPVGGRLVLFDARHMLHEVAPHTQPVERLALSLWIGGAHDPRGFVRHLRTWWLGAFGL